MTDTEPTWPRDRSSSSGNLMDAPTGIIPRPTLIERMYVQPGRTLLLVAEWVGIALTIAAGGAVVFLLVLGGYVLTTVTP